MLTEGVEVGQQNDNLVGWILENLTSEWLISVIFWDNSEEIFIPNFDDVT